MFSFKETALLIGSLALVIIYSTVRLIWGDEINTLPLCLFILLVIIAFAVFAFALLNRSKKLLKTHKREVFESAAKTMSIMETLFTVIIVNLLFCIIDLIKGIALPSESLDYMLKMTLFLPWLSEVMKGNNVAFSYSFTWQIVLTLFSMLLMTATSAKYFKARKIYNALVSVPEKPQQEKVFAEAEQQNGIVLVSDEFKETEEQLIAEIPHEEMIPNEAYFKRRMREVSDTVQVPEIKARTCPVCGSENEGYKTVCEFCGAKLDELDGDLLYTAEEEKEQPPAPVREKADDGISFSHLMVDDSEEQTEETPAPAEEEDVSIESLMISDEEKAEEAPQEEAQPEQPQNADTYDDVSIDEFIADDNEKEN